ncbi:MAG: bifunctional pyr operon transcriptional regulator/uracil phosphoribosyltransferase PyrR [Rhodothermales bacterium]|nr:bifunctional pyr operon transcriptional regulator/uracil phosphoribosyltransferase PyrR [Rhodothermales bacterium]
MPRTLILSGERVRRTINRLAFEVIEHNRGVENLVIVGVRSGGTGLAEALAAHIHHNEGHAVRVEHLDVTEYRDDRDRTVPRPAPLARPATIDDRDVLLVDDVLFTGRTARAALDAIVHLGRPRSIQLLVLIDRGHREYPIQANFVGRTIQTKHIEQVVVDAGDSFAVYIAE